MEENVAGLLSSEINQKGIGNAFYNPGFGIILEVWREKFGYFVVHLMRDSTLYLELLINWWVVFSKSEQRYPPGLIAFHKIPASVKIRLGVFSFFHDQSRKVDDTKPKLPGSDVYVGPTVEVEPALGAGWKWYRFLLPVTSTVAVG